MDPVLRAPCIRAGCDEPLQMQPDPLSRRPMLFQHGANPEAVLRVDWTPATSVLERIAIVRGWLGRIHGPRPWEADAS